MNAIIKYIFSTLFKKRETTSATGLRAALYDPVEDKFYWIDGASIGGGEGGGGGGDLDPLVIPTNTDSAALKCYFAGDTDTGIYNPAANQFGVVVGSLVGMTIVSSSGSTIVTTTQLTTTKFVATGVVINLTTLTDAATITPNPQNGSNCKVTLAGNRTLAAPSVDFAGVFTIIVKQDATGSRTLTLASAYKNVDGVAPVLSTSPAAIDILTVLGDGAGNYYVIPNLNFA